MDKLTKAQQKSNKRYKIDKGSNGAEFYYPELRVWRGKDGGISLNNKDDSIFANVPKGSKLYDHLNRFFELEE
jgi:hypothetical protein